MAKMEFGYLSFLGYTLKLGLYDFTVIYRNIGVVLKKTAEITKKKV